MASVEVERLGDPPILPPRPRLSGERLALLAALAGLAAIALGGVAMAATLGSDAASPAQAPATPPTTIVESPTWAVSLLARPTTERIPFAHSRGRIILAVGRGGRGVLVLDALGPARRGTAYAAWLLGRRGSVLGRAAVFSGRERLVALSKLVPRGGAVGVTIEKAGGVAAPTHDLVLVARRAG